MKKIYLFGLFSIASLLIQSQSGYDIKINLKGCVDSTVYLAKYSFDQVPINDSCKNIKGGKIQFKGDVLLDKGVYILANQARNSFYFQFIVDDNQKFTINADAADIAASLKSQDNKQNDLFFSYVKFMTEKNKELYKTQSLMTGKSKADSTRIVNEKQTALSKEMTQYDVDFRLKNKSLFVADLMNMKAEKYPTDVPLASNGRPDSIYQFYYYKNHFWDGVNFKDDRIVFTPFFADKIKKYFEKLVIQHPDSVIKDLDKILTQCVPGSTMFNTLVGHFTYKFEQNKSMSFDQYGKSNTFEKVFIHLADKYIITGKTAGYYSVETIAKIKERVDILRNLLPGAKVANLFMIDTIHGREVLKMGFDTAKSSVSVTYLYNKNISRLTPLFKSLYDINAKYTVLVFWAADCSHCTKEIPKLYEDLQQLKGKVDVKVFAVQTKEELFDSWKQFLIEKKLKDFTHVFDPIHLNNLKEQFDITATPVIYLLDKDKNIIAKKLSHEQVVEIVEQLEKVEKNLKK
ncbi:redoxin domain-containing protein [Aurantibacillus circumpalustris]|uniref:redoxin domain-containing protein n=1 Tax=Aurantibacillus circumpalustris TaxID=3036359 RepID=UPI00295B9C63|nr:redoxin domain-containing protein [Aurantibacillus circumpalustris]